MIPFVNDWQELGVDTGKLPDVLQGLLDGDPALMDGLRADLADMPKRPRWPILLVFDLAFRCMRV